MSDKQWWEQILFEKEGEFLDKETVRAVIKSYTNEILRMRIPADNPEISALRLIEAAYVLNKEIGIYE